MQTVDVIPLTSAQADEAFALATSVFIEGSTLHKALGITLSEYRAYLRPSFDAMVSKNLSVAAIDRSSNEVLGCMIATDLHGQINAPETQDPKFAPLTALTQDLCREYVELFPPKPGETVLVDMAAVSPSTRGGGLYKRMRAKTHQIAKSRGFTFVVGELSSSATQHVILNHFRHQVISEIRFTEFEVNGTFPFAGITTPPSIVLARGTL